MDSSVQLALHDAGVRISERFDGARFELPPRPPLRPVGIALAVFGALASAFMVFWMWGPISQAFGGRQVHLFSLIFGLLGLPGLLIGLTMFFGGLALWTGRSRAAIELSGGQLRVFEYFPPFRWSWRRNIADIRRFTLGLSPEEEARKGERPDRVAGYAQRFLRAEGSFPKPLWIAALYPPALLRTLADALADATHCAQPAGTPPPAVVVEEGVAAGAADEPVLPRPPKSAVTLQEYGEGFAFDVPPVGVGRGSKGLFFFSLLWLGMCVLVFGIPFWGGGTITDVAPLLLFGLLFIGVGVAMLLAAIHMGRRRAMLAANAKTLGLRRKGLFGEKEERVPRAEVAAIRCGPSGVEINDRPLMELQIHLRGGRKIGCLSQLTEDEIRWIAQELRRRLAVPARGPAA